MSPKGAIERCVMRLNYACPDSLIFVVKSFGTENRPVPKHVPPRSEVYEYIIFRGSDIKDLHVSEVSKQEEQPPDPAILSVSA